MKECFYEVCVSCSQFEWMCKAVDFELRVTSGDLESTLAPLCVNAWHRSASGEFKRDHEPHLPKVDERLVQDMVLSSLRLLRRCAWELEDENIDLEKCDDYAWRFRALASMREILSAHKSRTGKVVMKMDSPTLRLISNDCELLARSYCGQFDFHYDWLIDAALAANAKLHGREKPSWRNNLGYDSVACKIFNHLRMLCWNVTTNAHWGLGYCDESDRVWDLYTYFRHSLWLERAAKDRYLSTVDSSPGWHHFEAEPAPQQLCLGRFEIKQKGEIHFLRSGADAKVSLGFADFARMIISICDEPVKAKDVWSIGEHRGWTKLINDTGGRSAFLKFMKTAKLTHVKRYPGKEDLFVYTSFIPYDPLAIFSSDTWYWFSHHRDELRASRNKLSKDPCNGNG